MLDPSDPPFGVSVINLNVTAAGTTQATATQLDALTSIVTTVPPGSGVQVVRPARYKQTIINAGANALNIWPRPGMALWPAARDTAVVLQAARTMILTVVTDAQGYVIATTSSFG